MGSEEKFDVELFFSALADKTRLRLLNLMSDGEVCVCFFAATMKLLAEDREMAADKRQFAKFCCAPGAPVMTIGRARAAK